MSRRRGGGARFPPVDPGAPFADPLIGRAPRSGGTGIAPAGRGWQQVLVHHPVPAFLAMAAIALAAVPVTARVSPPAP